MVFRVVEEGTNKPFALKRLILQSDEIEYIKQEVALMVCLKLQINKQATNKTTKQIQHNGFLIDGVIEIASSASQPHQIRVRQHHFLLGRGGYHGSQHRDGIRRRYVESTMAITGAFFGSSRYIPPIYYHFRYC
jgi:hypothetical protein